ncbi:ABC transporter ATP-binding protein [Galbibacter sp.]|uniref:ABC transporter ATP-binding protein n=1 Tax=Galbibacter sp. TaxID=2918471 RepID=UPI002B6DD284|nr:ABC transporter ATP-binding protein [Galbibacter sp.]HLV63088.1 ABC transporter ATP-binding protein [Galbibacter sp.]
MTLPQLFKNVWPFVKPYGWLVFAALFLTLIGSFTAQVNALILKYTVDEVNALLQKGAGLKEGLNILIIISIILLSKELINVFITFGQKYYGEKLRIYVSRDLAQTIVDKILTYRMSFYTSTTNESGKLQTRIDRGIGSLTQLVQNFFINILPLFANSFIALVLMFNANFWVGLVGICIVPVYILITIKQAKTLSGWRRNMREFRERKSQGIVNIIQSITVIKSFNREAIESDKQNTIQIEMTDNQLRTQRTGFLFNGVKTFVEQIGTVIIIILTAYLVLQGYMSIGMIMFHILLFNNVTAPIGQLHRIFDQMNDAMIYSESYFEILNSEQEVESSGTYKPEAITGKFEIKNVHFTYPNGTEALKGINITIEPNKITALVGLSGAGKSTVINLLDKFYQPTKGEIYLDGIPLKEYDTQFIRNNIGLVLQKNHIFSGSIADNIRYGNPHASIKEVEHAAKQAYIYQQIMELEEQFESNALLLSGGQQQRIAIARMFLKNPPIIFLDEPTASLDAIATEQIKNSLDAIKKDRTVIIISHSISQIIDADRIYVMEKGSVVESGTHQEIYANESVYRNIFDAMARSLNIEKIAKTFDDGEEHY